MPAFREAEADARERLVQKGKGYQARQVYRDMLAQVGGGRTIEVRPEDGETIRKLKVNIRRAANELKLENIHYGETRDGMLLVWSEPKAEGERKRGGPRKAAMDSGAA
jgi:hypothetical protein